MTLSAAASTVLKYARTHAVDSVAEVGEDLALPARVVTAACRELKQLGLIRDYGVSEESVEYIDIG